MAVIEKNAVLPPVIVFASGSTASVANNANALSATIDPTATAVSLYPRARFAFSGTFGGVPAANSAIILYFRLPTDGTLTGTAGSAFETDLGRTTLPTRPPAGMIGLDAANATQARVSEPIDLPAVPFQVIAVNAATGQALNSGWSLALTPETRQGA